MRWFLELSYSGAGFHGWQYQPNASSVQQTIEESLAILLRTPTPIVGAGRTDTGVNARRMFAHFDTQNDIKDVRKFLLSLNRLCGKGIAFHNLFRVRDDAHARFDATQRCYKYFVAFEKSPFLDASSWQAPYPLDVDAMNRAAKELIGVKDFTSFAKLHTDVKTNICDLQEAHWDCWQNQFDVPGIVFTIRADRFLRNMVRAVVGTLVDVGRGKLSVEGFRNVMDAMDRCSAGTSMPPQALFLWDVAYDWESIRLDSTK